MVVDGTAELTPTRALQQLEESRSFLQRLIGVASAIEGLKHSVEDMLAQEEAAGNEPGMASFVEGLGRKVRNMPDAEVLLRLGKLDRRIGGLFSGLMPLIDQISAGALVEEHQLMSSSNDIDALKRLSRTALAVRGMLTRRGVKFPDFRLPLDRVQLQQKLSAIAHEEQRARREVIQQVRVMGNDLRQLLLRPELPVAMRNLLDQMQAGLLANLEHLRAGHSVAELPLPIEMASFLGPLPGGAAASPDPEIEAVSHPEEERIPQSPLSPVAPVPEKVESGARPGFLRAVWLWIGSPWEVSWRDIREGRYRG